MYKNEQFVTALSEWVELFMQRSMQGFIHFMKERNLSMSQMGALFHLNRKGSCGVSDISMDLGVSNAAASQMLERLVQQGLIYRAEDPHDRRAKRIELTDAGRTIVQESIEARQRWFSKLSKSLSEEERVQTGTALEILSKKIKEMEIQKA